MSDPEDLKKRGHTLTDHLYGQNIVHQFVFGSIVATMNQSLIHHDPDEFL